MVLKYDVNFPYVPIHPWAHFLDSILSLFVIISMEKIVVANVIIVN